MSASTPEDRLTESVRAGIMALVKAVAGIRR
jgi:hypothetical protein